jgi:hypothetical protein
VRGRLGKRQTPPPISLKLAGLRFPSLIRAQTIVFVRRRLTPDIYAVDPTLLPRFAGYPLIFIGLEAYAKGGGASFRLKLWIMRQESV